MSGFSNERTVDHAQAIVRRGDAVQFQWWVRVWTASVAARPLVRGDGRLRSCGMLEQCR